MRWPWHKKRPPSRGQVEATEALDRANRSYAQALTHQQEARRVSNELRIIRERNHFAEQISLAMRGKRS